MAAKISKDEQQWRAESDANIMAQYQAITEDPNRMRRAIKVAQQQAKDLTKRANAMQNVANSGRAGRGLSRSTGRKK
jgi:hypothetical protein